MPNFDMIYLDHAATTPIHPAVIDAMMPYLTHVYGNASSVHRWGREAKSAIRNARDTLAQAIHCSPSELIFTSGGTESNNTAIFGAATLAPPSRRRIVTSSIEHHAVLHPCKELERLGFEVIYVPVNQWGQVDVNQLEAAINPNTAIVSIMFGNNEVGTLQPIEQIGLMAKSQGAYFHVDAVQALGHLDLDVSRVPVDFMSFSAHKINGPKGIGALYVNRTVKFQPYLYGGNQERSRRAGTENVANIVGFAEAVKLVMQQPSLWRQKLVEFQSVMMRTLQQRLPPDAFVVNGHPIERLPHILNISFPGTTTQSLLMNMDLDGIAAASGSACSSGSIGTSHVLQAMGLQQHLLHSAIRLSFGYDNCLENVTNAAEKIATIVQRLTYK
jgi:cysteine desulfurase